jgi:hypothetical protein
LKPLFFPRITATTRNLEKGHHVAAQEKSSSSVPGAHRWWALALLAIAEFVVVLDASIVNIALPSIGRGLHFSLANLSWVVNAYVLTFGGFLLLGGRLADLLPSAWACSPWPLSRAGWLKPRRG